TSQMFTNEENGPDQEDLCANQEGNFKTPFDKTAVDSQFFSTPKVFRHSRVLSPEPDDDRSFTNEQDPLPWTATQSPYLFRMSKEGYAKQISESLGAQIHPDISWTSSLNTPPFVRKLFPSLSNASRVGALSPKHTDVPALEKEPQDSPQSSLDQSGGVWRQKLPDAIEDGEIRSTVASVLDGAENVLSIFFTNSSSALRKVKTERNKRKQIIQTKENDCSAEDISATKNISSSTQRTEDQDPGKCFSSPVGQTGVTGISQWSPLSLSEIAPCTMDTSCQDKPATQLENKSNVKHLQNGADSGQVLGPPFTHSGLTKKKRKFIYTVGTQGKETHVKARLEKTQDKADCCSFGESEMQKQDNFTEENRPPSLQAKVHDLDMSQLCRDFAEDFSQISDLSKVSKLPEDPAQNNFSPSACLSALKQAKQKARQANLHWNFDGFSNRHASATDTNSSINDGTMSDSGFQSTVADTTSIVFPKTDAYLCNAIKESQTLDSGTKSELHKESNNTQLPSSLKGTVENINCNLQNGQLSGSLPKETIASLPSIHASGFKTASNKGIHMSLANLERAKHLFQENEAEKTFSDQPTINACDTKDEITLSHGSVKNTTSSSSQLQSSSEKFGSVTCQLTASQKADVTELCTLLEEADSQFEFTQFKTAKLKPHCQDNPISLQKADKELDPDFLTGIDFDDSFNSEAENSTVSAEPKTLARTEHSEINKQENKNPLILAVGFKTAQGNILTVSKKCLSKAKALFADIENSLEHQKSPEKQSSDIDAKTDFKNRGMDFSGFHMDTGKDMQEVDAPFKDCSALDSNTNMSVKHRTSTEIFPGSVNHKKRHPELKNVQNVKANVSEEPIRELKENSGPAAHHSNLVQPRVNIHSVGFENTPALTNAVSFSENQPLTVKTLSSSSCTTLKDTDSFAINELSNDCAFDAANGKNIFVSVDAVKKAESLLNEIHTLGERDKQLKEKGDALRPGHHTNQIQVAPSRNGGFQTASGKGVVISTAALKKAKSLKSESCGFENINTKPNGKGVVISTAALKKAKSLLNDVEAVEDNISEKPAQSKMLIPCPQSRNSGFQAASGKPVAPSAEALQKAKALFSDISVDIPGVSDTRKSESCGFENINTKPKHNEDTLLPQNG
uniref:BRCA2 DNA repair associated n=1 Tax=Anabas testudineus TaxID=64144 RepID=A0A7N6BFS6_ANATE